MGRYTPMKLVDCGGAGDWVPLAGATNDIRVAKLRAMMYLAQNKGCLGAGVIDENDIVYEVTAKGWRDADGVELEASATSRCVITELFLRPGQT